MWIYDCVDQADTHDEADCEDEEEVENEDHDVWPLDLHALRLSHLDS